MSIRKLLCIALASLPLVLVGCGGSGGSDDPVVMPDPGPDPDPVDNSFATFVIDQFAATSDKTDPEDVDDREFTFDDGQNPDAFNELFDGDGN